jgi:hypothetical protein
MSVAHGSNRLHIFVMGGVSCPRSLLCGSVGPVTDIVDLAIGESGTRVYPGVGMERHVTTRDCVADILHLSMKRLSRIPHRKIHFLDPLVHVALNQPRGRSNVAIPRKTCMTGVAVNARSVENLCNF